MLLNPILQKTVNDSKLVTLLSRVTKQEFKQLDKYVHSPIFNQNESVVQLYLYLKKHAPEFLKPILRRDLIVKVFKVELKKGQSISSSNEKRLKDSMFRLTKLVEQFFIYLKQVEQPIRNNHLLIRALTERELKQFIPPLFKKNRELLDEMPYRDSAFYFDQFLQNESEFHYLVRFNNRSNSSDIQVVIDNFTSYSVGHLLRYYCAAINGEKYLNMQHEYPLLDTLLRYIESKRINHNPLICIYYYILKLLQEEGTATHFDALKKLLSRHSSDFPLSELRQMYSFAINYCNNQVKNGVMTYQSELFKLYETVLERRLLNCDKHFSPHFYLLIVKNALAVGKLDWAETFIQTYQSELPDSQQQPMYAFSLAYWYFYKKEYDKALGFLLQIGTPEDFYYNFYYRILQFRICYEQWRNSAFSDKLLALASDHIEALRHYIRRRNKAKNKQMSSFVLKSYDNFQKLSKRLLDLAEDPEFKKNPVYLQQRLQGDILTIKPLEERNWLLEKVGEL